MHVKWLLESSVSTIPAVYRANDTKSMSTKVVESVWREYDARFRLVDASSSIVLRYLAH